MSRLPDPELSRALLIGVSAYAEPERWQPLPAVERNLTDLRDALTDSRLWGLPPEHCTTILNPTDSGPVLEAVHSAARAAQDTVLVYYAGHGSTIDSDLLLTMASTTSDNLLFRALRFSVARDLIQQRRATNAVVLLDCCFSGMAHPMADLTSFVERQLAAASAYTLTSSARDSISLAPPGERNTAFTGELLKVLTSGVQHAPELLSLGTVARTVTQNLVDRRFPAPSHSQTGQGDQLALTRNVGWRPPQPSGGRSGPRPSRGFTAQDLAIKVVGVGGAGVNAVNRMIEVGVAGVEFIAINTDAQALLMSDADVTVDIGKELVRGLGAGANPEVGRKAAELHRDAIAEVLSGSELVFVACGEGGGTGTGGAPVVASIARSLGALTIGVVTRPFSFEGRRRTSQADEGIKRITMACDAVMVIPNDRLLSLSGHQVSIMDGFRMADQVLVNAVRGITDLTTTPGLISIGYGAVRQMLTGAGPALIAIGEASGAGRAARSAASAISSQLTEQNLLAAQGVIISVAGSSELRYEEVQEVVALVTEAADQDANVIFGAVLDDSLSDSLRTTVVAVGPPHGAWVEVSQQQVSGWDQM